MHLNICKIILDSQMVSDMISYSQPPILKHFIKFLFVLFLTKELNHPKLIFTSSRIKIKETIH